MWIMMEIDGWQKKENVHPALVDRGRIDIRVREALSLAVRPKDRVPSPQGIVVTLYHIGRKVDGMPVFECA